MDMEKDGVPTTEMKALQEEWRAMLERLVTVRVEDNRWRIDEVLLKLPDKFDEYCKAVFHVMYEPDRQRIN